MSNQTAHDYIPFSNGSEYDLWYANNCEVCKFGNMTEDGLSICTGQHGIDIGIMLGEVPVMALDFIGTTDRTVQENGYAFCDLNARCNQFLPKEQTETV